MLKFEKKTDFHARFQSFLGEIKRNNHFETVVELVRSLEVKSPFEGEIFQLGKKTPLEFTDRDENMI